MGLLDQMGLDPGTLALAGGLLSPGSFGQGLSRGIAGSQEARLREQQIAEAQQAQQMRALQMQRTMQQLKFGDQFLSDTGGATPSTTNLPSTMPAASAALASGAQNGSLGPTPQNAATMGQMAQPTTVTPAQKSKLGQLTQDQIAAGVVSGVIPKELVELWQNEKFGRALPPGWKQNLDGSMIYVPDPTKGVTMGADGKTVVAMPGAAQTLGDLAAATKGGETRGANQNTPIPLDRIDRGLPQGVTPFSTVDELLNGRQTPGAPLSAQPPALQRMVAASAGGAPATFNGQPIATAPVPGGFKTPAQMEAEKLLATQGVHAETDPVVALRKDVVTQSHASNQKFIDNLSDVVNNEAELVSRNNRIKPYLDQLSKAGGWGYDQRANFANNLKNSGLPYGPEVAKWVTNGDPAAAKVVSNQLAAAAITNMLDTLNKEGKPNRVIFQALHDEQEALKNGKDVLGNVMALQKQLYDQHQSQLDSATDLMASPTYNPIKFASQFASKKADSIGTPPATPTPTMRWNPKTQKIEMVN